MLATTIYAIALKASGRTGQPVETFVTRAGNVLHTVRTERQEDVNKKQPTQRDGK